MRVHVQIIKKEKCPKCKWKGFLAKCIAEDYEWNGGPLAYAAGTFYSCPRCLTKIREGNSIRS
jgi:ferredoxin-like protein FixX